MRELQISWLFRFDKVDVYCADELPIEESNSSLQACIMMAANVLIIATMKVQGKGLAEGTKHDEMVDALGITWLLSGTALVSHPAHVKLLV